MVVEFSVIISSSKMAAKAILAFKLDAAA